MFRTVWSKTLREYRIAILGWGIGLGLLLFAEFASAATLDTASLSSVGQLAKMIRLFGDPLTFTTPDRIVLERFGAVFIAAVVVLLATWLSIQVGASMTDVRVDAGNVAAASFGILPLELIVAALVYVLAGRLHPGTILGIVGTFIALSFFVELLHTVLKLPEWAKLLSIFHQYGSPVTDGWQWGPFLAMLGVAALLLATGVVQFTYADVERGA